MVIKLDPTVTQLIGIISDTHGYLPAGVAKAFKKVDSIVHAGDIGDAAVLAKLKKMVLRLSTPEARHIPNSVNRALPP